MRKFRPIVSNSLLLLALTLVSQLVSAECGLVKFEKFTKPNIVVRNNYCTEPEISLGSNIFVESGRSIRMLTLNSKTLAKERVVCQNRTRYQQQFTVISKDMPWLMPESTQLRCNSWNKKRLECTVIGFSEQKLICEVVKLQNAAVRKFRNGFKAAPPRMRSPSEDDSQNNELEKVEDVLTEYLLPKVDECRERFHSDKVFNLIWTIKANGEVGNAEVSDETNRDDFVDCAVEVIEHFIFPELNNDVSVSYVF